MGILLSSAGTLAILVGGLVLSRACGPVYSVCDFPREISEAAYFLAMLGTALVVKGVQQAGIGRNKIRAEGGGLVVAAGAIISTIGFMTANILPLVSLNSAEIGFSLGAVGTALVAFGLVKLDGGRIGASTNPGPESIDQHIHRPSSQTAAIVGIVSILVLSTLILGLYFDQSGLCACGLVLPPGGREALNLGSSSFNSSTNVTLTIRDTGTIPVTLIAYYVRDQAGQQYGNSSWSGPTINPNIAITTIITIDGSSFVFQAGNSYTVFLRTSRNNQFVFTIVR